MLHDKTDICFPRASVSPSYARERCFFKERQTNCSSDQGYRPFNISIKEKELLLLTVTAELHMLRDIKRHKTDRAFPGSCLDGLDEDSRSACVLQGCRVRPSGTTYAIIDVASWSGRKVT